jgi:hypothetical protein
MCLGAIGEEFVRSEEALTEASTGGTHLKAVHVHIQFRLSFV